jgi:hypothetical protein
MQMPRAYNVGSAPAFLTSGYLRYSPKRLGDRVSPNWWLVLHCDSAIGKYYRELYRLATFGCDKLVPAAWKEHVTVIRDEEPPELKKCLWGKYDGETVHFTCGTQLDNNGEYFWLSVESERLLDIREELGLPRFPEIPLHLSVGHTDEKGVKCLTL